MSLAEPACLLETWERGSGETILGRAVTLLAAGTDLALEEAAEVDVGTRDALLAGLLRAAAGATVWTVAQCGGCGDWLDVPIDVDAVARTPGHEPGQIFEVSAEGTVVSYRLPTSADLAAVRGYQPEAARRRLLASCVRWPHGELPDAAAEAVESAMEAEAPASAVQVAIRCPSCETVTAAALDVAALLWAEVEASAVRLVHDVHTLARAYGWAEPEVLALSPRRRATYIGLAER